MNHPFRLLLPLSLAALMAASCAGSFVEEMEETEATGNVPVAFSATTTDMKPDAASRAATIPGEITTSTITSMGVFAYYTDAGNFNNSSSKANFMNDEEISRTAANQPWKYSPTKYWPNTAGEKITFLAYSPHSSHFTELDPFPVPKPERYHYQGGTFNVAILPGWDNLPYFDYAPRLQAEKQSDVLIATPIVDCTKKAGPITFEFDHLLAKILFKVKSTEKIHIDRINISGMSTYGCFYYKRDGTYAWDKIGPESDKAFYSLPNKDVPASTLPTDAATLMSTFFMIPCSETLDCLLDIHYTDASNAKVEKNDVPFSYIATKSGDVVAYTISIDKITLEVTVDPWDDTSTNDKLGNICVGDYYYTDGTVSPKPMSGNGKIANGMIYYIYPDNPKRFKVMALEQNGKKWANSYTYEIGSGAQSSSDGKANVAAIKDYFYANTNTVGSNFSEAFPAANYCDNYQGKGNTDAKGTWYLPAIDELQYMYCAYNGSASTIWHATAPMSANTAAQSKWNTRLTNPNVGGTIISRLYWSSTERSSDKGAWHVDFLKGTTNSSSKSYLNNVVRCVRDARLGG